MMKAATDVAKNVVKFLDRNSPRPLLYRFRMTKPERRVLRRYIDRCDYYLEFGSGGSTLFAMQHSDAVIHSVESSQEWAQYMLRYRVLNRALGKRLHFHHVDIGETRDWGFPVSNAAEHLFPRYSTEVFSQLDASKLDTVLIDGRFRVACTMSTILHLPPGRDATILIHDFWNREDKYGSVHEHLDLIERADLLAVFKVKEDVDLDRVRADYEAYQCETD